jgi:hypothetical protein
MKAVQGGAIYTRANVSIKYCTFANNSASNDDGNDVYVPSTSIFYNDASNIVGVCSASLSPQLLVNEVFIFFFLLSIFHFHSTFFL